MFPCWSATASMMKSSCRCHARWSGESSAWWHTRTAHRALGYRACQGKKCMAGWVRHAPNRLRRCRCPAPFRPPCPRTAAAAAPLPAHASGRSKRGEAGTCRAGTCRADTRLFAHLHVRVLGGHHPRGVLGDVICSRQAPRRDCAAAACGAETDRPWPPLCCEHSRRVALAALRVVVHGRLRRGRTKADQGDGQRTAGVQRAFERKCTLLHVAQVPLQRCHTREASAQQRDAHAADRTALACASSAAQATLCSAYSARARATLSTTACAQLSVSARCSAGGRRSVAAQDSACLHVFGAARSGVRRGGDATGFHVSLSVHVHSASSRGARAVPRSLPLSDPRHWHDGSRRAVASQSLEAFHQLVRRQRPAPMALARRFPHAGLVAAGLVLGFMFASYHSLEKQAALQRVQGVSCQCIQARRNAGSATNLVSRVRDTRRVDAREGGRSCCRSRDCCAPVSGAHNHRIAPPALHSLTRHGPQVSPLPQPVLNLPSSVTQTDLFLRNLGCAARDCSGPTCHSSPPRPLSCPALRAARLRASVGAG